MGHTVFRLTAHIVWVTKYRYQVLKGDVQMRCRDLIKQICDSKDHVHIHIEYPPTKKISNIVKRLKGRTSRRIQEVKKNFLYLEKDIGADIFGQLVMAFGVQEI